jgi:hypothetical protein
MRGSVHHDCRARPHAAALAPPPCARVRPPPGAVAGAGARAFANHRTQCLKPPSCVERGLRYRVHRGAAGRPRFPDPPLPQDPAVAHGADLQAVYTRLTCTRGRPSALRFLAAYTDGGTDGAARGATAGRGRERGPAGCQTPSSGAAAWPLPSRALRACDRHCLLDQWSAAAASTPYVLTTPGGTEETHYWADHAFMPNLWAP